jgi:hypothetical protein
MMVIVATSFPFFDFMRVATYDLALASSHRACDLVDFNSYGQFPLLISKLLGLKS